MITEDIAESAAEFIRANAANLAKAKSERIQCEEFRKTIKAQVISKATGTVQERESAAYASDEYKTNLDGYVAAVEREELLRWKMKSAELKIEIYRTQQANNRMTDRAHR